MDMLNFLLNKAAQDGKFSVIQRNGYCSLLVEGFGGMRITLAEVDDIDWKRMNKTHLTPVPA